MNMVRIWQTVVNTEDVSHAFPYKNDTGDRDFKIMFKTGKELIWTDVTDEKIDSVLDKLMCKTTLLDLLG